MKHIYGILTAEGLKGLVFGLEMWLYIRVLRVEKPFNPSAVVCRYLKIREKVAEGFDFQTFQHCSFVQCGALSYSGTNIAEDCLARSHRGMVSCPCFFKAAD